MKPADKGSGVVIMDKNDYLEKCMRLLYSEDFEELRVDPMKIWTDGADALIAKEASMGLWDAKIGAWLKFKRPKMSILYGLPKVHKNGVPLRPVVSSIDCPTMNLAKLVDFVLQPFVQSNEVFIIRDTKHFLKIIDQLNSENLEGSQVFSVDVEALHPSVPHQGAVQAVKELVPDFDWSNDKKRFFEELVTFVVCESYFQFDSKFFKQKRGVPIGSKCGCSIACIFMQWFEKRFFGENPGLRPRVYYRYTDDIFGVWKD